MATTSSPINLKIGFLTFGDGHISWRKTADRLEKSAKKSKYFIKAQAFSLRDIASDVTPSETDFMKHHRGFGYWIWKPISILRFIGENPTLDLILYLDAGCHLNINNLSKKLLDDFCSVAYKEGILAFRSTHNEKDWTKRDLLEMFPSEFANTTQFHATIIIGTPDALSEVCKLWINVAQKKNHHFIDDSPSILKNETSFQEHRHDQSILSLLLKSRGLTGIPDSSVYFVDYSEAAAFPIWITRHVSRSNFGKGGIRNSLLKILDRFDRKLEQLINYLRTYINKR